jgi:REP element-mobilizing transposase RayT
MGRPPRTIDDGLVYHALNRGNNRADVLGDDADRVAFLEAFAKTKERYPFRLLGYCLMTKHFHLLLRPEVGQSISRENPVSGKTRCQFIFLDGLPTIRYPLSHGTPTSHHR